MTETLKTYSDEDLLKEAHRLARLVSYYNAAEGNWRQETADRVACNGEFKKIMKEVNDRGLEFINEGYLL